MGQFQVIQVVSGELSETNIDILNDTPSLLTYAFRPGYRYLLPINVLENPYIGTRYAPTGAYVEFNREDEFVACRTTAGTVGRPKANELGQWKKYAQKLIGKNADASAWKVIYSDNMVDVVAGSDCVVRVTIQERIDRHYVDRYTVKVNDVLYGDAANLESVLFTLDTVQPGEEYVLLLDLDPSHVSGHFSSPTLSLISVEDTQELQEIKTAIEQVK